MLSMAEATFDDVLDVGPVGCYLEGVLWRASAFHVVCLIEMRDVAPSSK
jgi:hypothetical protein